MGFLRGKSDKKVLEEVKSGKEEAMLYLYKNHYTMVRNFVLKNNGTESEVEDIMQETIVAAWRNIIKEDFTLTSKLSTYIMSIAKNQWFKSLRKKKRFSYVDETSKEPQNEDNSFDHIDLNIVTDYVQNLDETCKKLLSYFYFDQFDNKTIAEKMGFANTDTVKSKKYQCFKKLEKNFKEDFSKEDFYD